MNMREMFLNAKDGSIMTKLGLGPIENERLRELKISNIHVHTFQNELKTYKSLEDYKRQVSS